MEWEREMYPSCVDPALVVLKRVLDNLPQYPPHLKNPIQTMYLDLRFFKMFFWGLAYQEESSQLDSQLRCVLSTMMRKFEQTAEEFQEQSEWVAYEEKITYWEPMSCRVRKSIKQYKKQAKAICLLVLDGAFKSCQFEELFLKYGAETASLIDLIQENLRGLELNVDLIAPVKKQIAFIERKLEVFGKFVSIAKDWPTRDIRLGELISHIQTWANHVSCLACLYWIDEVDETLASTMGTMLSDLIQKNMPFTPSLVALCLDVLKHTRYLKRHGTMIPGLLACYVDFLLECLVTLTKDAIEILREELTFLLSFVMDPPKDDSEEKELILAETYAIINEIPCVICIPDTNLSSFLHKVDRVKVKVRELHVLSPLSSQFNFPQTNVIGFLDSLLGKLEKMLEGKMNFFPSVQDHIKIFQEELALLRQLLQNNLELQNEDKKLKDLWTKIVNVVYYAAYVTNLCPITRSSFWYGIICLPNVIEDIKLINSEVKKIEDDQTYSKNKFNAEMESSNSRLTHGMTSKNEGVFIGFEEDVRSVLDHLVGGQKNLTIISISGMPGQGKTTLAKRIYNDPKVQYHFQKVVWCYVSKECKTRDLMVSIVHGVCGNVDVNLDINDLADCLRKSLKGKRYLIVFDDIWDVDVWFQVKESFPDDKKRSRILFTSRNHKLALEAKPNSISHHLRLFSDEESWALMKDKLSIYDDFPLEFLEVGKQIAVYCKGLPLAVAVIASHLKSTPQKLDLWKEVAENLKFHLASEGCMHIIELSYKYLPDHLKSCFLYFGAFPRGENIRARKLKLLWIAEGFVKENETQCSKDLAKEYLDNLVSQNLVVVSERSSAGGIKRCNVHDLLYDLCLEKAVEDNFLHLADRGTIIDEYCSSPQKYKFHHRLCIGESDPFTQPRLICSREELPTNRIHSLLWSQHKWWSHHRSPRPTYDSFYFFISSFNVLTVLDLEELDLNGSMFLEVILCNIHLTYLALWGGFGSIPASIVDLWSLETLILHSNSQNVQTPRNLWEMKSLRHVEINSFIVDWEGFEENETSMSAACNIETLGGIRLSYDCKTDKFVKRLSRLTKLSCYFDGEEFHSCISLFASVEKLESLRIVGRFGNGHLFSPNQQLPRKNSLDNLKKLVLYDFRLPWSARSTIGKLPNLEVLKLNNGACEGTTWDLGDGEFSKLRYLKLYNMVDVEQINDSDCGDPFPCLEKLLLICCWRLKEIPSSFGDICTLETINVCASPGASNSVRRILERRQQYMGNDNLQVLGLLDHNDNNDEEENEAESDDKQP